MPVLQVTLYNLLSGDGTYPAPLWDCPIQVGLPFLLNFAYGFLIALTAFWFVAGINGVVMNYTMSFGNEEKAKKAKEILKWTLIGCAILMVSAWIFQSFATTLTNRQQLVLAPDGNSFVIKDQFGQEIKPTGNCGNSAVNQPVDTSTTQAGTAPKNPVTGQNKTTTATNTKAGTFQEAFVKNAQAFADANKGKGTSVDKIDGYFGLTNNTCAGSLARVIRYTQKQRGHPESDWFPVGSAALCENLARYLVNGKYKATVIHGGYDAANRPFGPKLSEVQNSKRPLQFGDIVFNTVPNGRDHIWIYKDYRNQRFVRLNGGGPNWKEDSISGAAYGRLNVIVIRLEGGIWQ